MVLPANDSVDRVESLFRGIESGKLCKNNEC